MKLTKDMFDFEKYDYFDSSSPKDGEWWDDQEKLWKKAGGWWGPSAMLNGLCRKPRTPKLPPRYILLNEWDPLKPGDELLEQGHTSLEWGPPADHIVSGNVEPGEIWRRKVQE